MDSCCYPNKGKQKQELKCKCSVLSECSVLSNCSRKRINKEANLSNEIENPDKKKDFKSESISLVVEVEKGECSVSLNDTKKQRIIKFVLFGQQIEIEEGNPSYDPSKISVSVDVSLPGSDKNRGTSNCVDKYKEIASTSPKDSLTLALNGEEDIDWKITKKLTKSDVDQTQNRLLIAKESMEKHIFPYLDQSERERLSNVGSLVPIIVKDCDRNCEVSLFLKKWVTGSHVVSGGDNKDVNWYKSIVFPNKLKVDDLIGLKFDGCTKKLLLGLLTKSNNNGC